MLDDIWQHMATYTVETELIMAKANPGNGVPTKQYWIAKACDMIQENFSEFRNISLSQFYKKFMVN